MRFKTMVRHWADVATERADGIAKDREPLYPISGTETVNYVKGSDDELLNIAARCLYEIAMRERQGHED